MKTSKCNLKVKQLISRNSYTNKSESKFPQFPHCGTRGEAIKTFKEIIPQLFLESFVCVVNRGRKLHKVIIWI